MGLTTIYKTGERILEVKGKGACPPWRSAPFTYNVRGFTLMVVGQGVGFPLHRCHAASAGFGAAPQGVGVGVGVRFCAASCLRIYPQPHCLVRRWAQANTMVVMVTKLHATC